MLNTSVYAELTKPNKKLEPYDVVKIQLEALKNNNKDDNGIKQTWLAEKLGKSYNMVNGYVQNRQQPRLEILFEIAKILEVEVKDLIKEVKN